MKIQFCLLALILATIGCSNSGGDSSPAAAASTITISPNPATVATSGSIMITPTGGTPPYTFTLMSSIGGYMSQPTGDFTTFMAGTTSGTAELQVTDSAAQTQIFPIEVGTGVSGLGGASLVVTPASTSVAVGGTDIITVSGGTGVYTYSANYGTLSGNSASATYIASGTVSGEIAQITVQDTAGDVGYATITIGGTAAGSLLCDGTFNMDLAGTSATLTLIEDANGNIAGEITVPSEGSAPVQGTCSGTSVSFTNLFSGSPYTGSVIQNAANLAEVIMTGTFTYGGSTYSWTASD